MGKYSVIYQETFERELVIEATSLDEANELVKKVLGDDIEITRGWELHGSSENN